MSAARLALLLLLSSLTTVVSGCNGPFLILPGGHLDGEATPAPADWSIAGEYGFTELETNPDDPYSVNIVYTVVNGLLYINAGDTETKWVKNMGSNPAVRLRIDGAVYALVAERVTDAAEIAEFGKAWTSRSMFSRDPAELDEVWVFRLSAP